MKRVTLAAVVLAAVVACGDSSATTTPALRLVDSSPLTVRGVGFEPRERVRVTGSHEGERTTKLVRATLRGSFTVVFENTALRCGTTVRAVGTLGSRAALKLPQLACPPPLTRP